MNIGMRDEKEKTQTQVKEPDHLLLLALISTLKQTGLSWILACTRYNVNVM